MAPIPFVLVTGWLGSGKTTLVKRLIAQEAGRRRLAIVQNEFSGAGIDGADLRATGHAFSLLEINQGSVFCVCLLGEFRTSLAAFCREHRPDAVILEASGLSDPLAVAQILEAPELRGLLILHRVLCLVDAVGFPKLEGRMARMAHQVLTADHLVLNRIDLADPDSLPAIERRLHELNPLATIERTIQAQADLAGLWSPGPEPPVAVRLPDHVRDQAEPGRPDLASVAVRRANPVSEPALRAFLDRVGPACLRLKGIVRLRDGRALMVQQTPGQLTWVPLATSPGATELVAIGPGLDAMGFRREFDGLD